MPLRPVAFYAVAEERHFLGLVALLNSLRLQGHREPLVVADCGLAAWQLALLEEHAEVVGLGGDRLPVFLKPVLPLERPAETMVLLDADLVLVRSLAALLAEDAAATAFADPVAHRFHADWEHLLGLPELRRQAYVNSGLLVFSGDRGRSVLEVVAEKQERIDPTGTRGRQGRPEDPFYYADQDVWNSVLASVVRPEELSIHPADLAPHPPFEGLRQLDLHTLRCAYGDGREPFVLHHVDRKPWLAATRANLYSRLLPRLLLGEDVALRLEPSQIPLRLRSGVSAALERLRVEAAALAWKPRGSLGLRRWLARRRRSRS
jgi:hypothetical protein